MVSDAAVATIVLVVVTASLPFYLYGAWVMIDAETVDWDLLLYHLKFIAVGLTLTTVPVGAWMVPRLLKQLDGLASFHALLGLQAYAMLIFALTGIVRIFQVKYRADLYRDPDEEIDLDDLHENVGAWRTRLRVGVFGYVLFWLGAYALGVVRFVLRYVA